MDFSKYVYQRFVIRQCRQYIIVFEISDNMYVSQLPLGKLDIFSLMCGTDKVWITKLTLNYKILGQIVTRMRQFIGQSDVKHIITSLITTITSVLKALTDIITNIPAHSSRVTEILAIMSVSTFKIDIILYLLCVEIKEKIYKSLIKLYFRSNKTKKYSYKDQNYVCSCSYSCFLDFLFLWALFVLILDKVSYACCISINFSWASNFLAGSFCLSGCHFLTSFLYLAFISSSVALSLNCNTYK